jgi:glycosyltransferase involved in cell wall biosynthesis
VLLEAMSRGIAIAATDYRAIPEMLDYGRAGLLSPAGDVRAFASNLILLLNPETNLTFRKAARDRFERFYSADVVPQELLASYLRTLRAPETISNSAWSADQCRGVGCGP